MSHLLRSVNPEAADAIQPDPERQPLPDVGDVVKYHMRQGWAREGRTIFPALVQGHGPNDTLMLTVIVDAGDLVDEQHVEHIGVGKQFHVWELPAAVRPLAERIEQPAGLLGEVKGLEALILGEYDRPNVSIIGIMVDFENRLRMIKKENEALRALLSESAVAAPDDEPAPKPKRATKKKAKRK